MGVVWERGVAVRHATEKERVVFREGEDLPLGWAFGDGERDGHTDVLRFSEETVNRAYFGDEECGCWKVSGQATHRQDAEATKVVGGMPKPVANQNKSRARLWRLGDVVWAIMSSLAEIERAADVLQTEEKQELVMFLLTRLRGEGGVLPPVRDIPKEQIEKWVAEDEAGYQRFLAGA